MTGFHAPVDDILFSLAHVAGASGLDDWDGDTTRDVLHHFGQFAEDVLAPLNAVGDRQGLRLENGRVRMPDGFGAAYRQLAQDGWQGLTAPEGYGGMAAQPLVAAGVSEIFSGANHALQMVCTLVPGAVATLLKFGTRAQCDHWVPKLVSGAVLSTMCLTEPAAGSDLSGIRTRAEPVGDGWRIDGEKIFISGGDQDMSEGILHLVLARSGTPGQGVRGLSLFLCAAQPGIRVARLEEKMGLHASPTCHMVFDGAQAELIGQEGAGLAAMFTLMNHARLDVALQGVAHAARAADLAMTYARERRQGRRADGSPAVLTDHTDVQRMLDAQARLAIGARAMCHVTLVEIETGGCPELIETLTSLCKVFGSEAGPKAADLGLQILGGYGYLTEYGMEQIWRDSRICAIYEGANGIHTRALVTRGMRPDGADAFDALMVRLLDGAVPPALQDWRNWRHRVEQAADPLPLAQGYYQALARVFEVAVWHRIRDAADQHPTPARIGHLARLVLEDKGDMA